jgi:hypothetical protein
VRAPIQKSQKRFRLVEISGPAAHPQLLVGANAVQHLKEMAALTLQRICGKEFKV